MTEERRGELFPADRKAEWADAFAVYANLIPVFGGAVSHVLSGWSQERRMLRVREVLDDAVTRIKDLGARLDEGYVKSDEFEDLLDRTLRQVAAERHQEKRRLYAAFLAGAVGSSGEPGYQEQLRFLRTLEELQPDHVRILRAIREEPDLRHAVGSDASDFLIGKLQERLPDISAPRVAALAEQLADDLKLTVIGGRVGILITPSRETGEMPDRFTDYGLGFIRYILGAKENSERD
jgi:hypothetical protein